MITTLVTHGIAAAAGAITAWLFLRNNPRIQTKANSLADQAEQLAKNAKRG